jgi:HEAT repeat protein
MPTLQEHKMTDITKMEQTRDVPGLIRALKDKDWNVRMAAAVALGNIGDAQAVKPLIARLKDKERLVRGSAAEALGNIGDVGAVKPLYAALKRHDALVHEKVTEALAKIKRRAAEQLAAAELEAERFRDEVLRRR